MNIVVISRCIFTAYLFASTGSISTVAAFTSHSQPFTHLSSGAISLKRRNSVHTPSPIVLSQSSRTPASNELVHIIEENASPTPLERYTQLTTDHYLLMAFLQAAFLASGADIATQTMEGGASSIDFSHVAAMATVASTFSGAINAVWLRQLEQTFPGTGTREVATKTLIHAIILASIINSAYLVGVPFFSTCFSPHDALLQLPHLNIATIFDSWNLDEFLTLTKLEVAMFIPYNTLAFKFVPPHVRPLTHATISATFNVAVSAIT